MPIVSIEVESDIIQGPVTGMRRDKESGLGDVVLIPLLLKYQHSPDLNIDARLTRYAPTGNARGCTFMY